MGEKISVDLKVTSIIRDGTDTHRQEQQLGGHLYDKNGTIYLRYVEKQEDGDTLQNTVIIRDEKITIRRQGAAQMNHTFQLGEVTRGMYDTAYGRFEMETKTTQLSFEQPEGDKQGRLLLKYDLWLNHSEAGNFELEINIMSKPTLEK